MASRRLVMVMISKGYVTYDDSQELYEPLWEALYHKSKEAGFQIRGIWIADVAHQGASSVLNENKLGNDRKQCTKR